VKIFDLSINLKRFSHASASVASKAITIVRKDQHRIIEKNKLRLKEEVSYTKIVEQ